MRDPAPPVRSGFSLTRTERMAQRKQRLFQAGVTIVGSEGYANAAVWRITELAEVAQGTFYNYFASRQELLDQLLPRLGMEMLQFIRERVRGVEQPLALETARFQAFLDFIGQTPHFIRILHEARLFAPAGYEKHMRDVAADFLRTLRDRNPVFSPEELEIVAKILAGAWNYLSYSLIQGGDTRHAGGALLSAYRKFISSGISARAPVPLSAQQSSA